LIAPGAPFRRRPSSPFVGIIALAISIVLPYARIPNTNVPRTRLLRCAQIGAGVINRAPTGWRPSINSSNLIDLGRASGEQR
jgi:hypothetical protein